MREYIIKTVDVNYQIQDLKILDQISLQIEKNHFIGLVGPNGSGKTTFIKHLYRAIKPSKKAVYINGNAIEDMTQKQLAHALTVMKQENTSDLEYTVFQMAIMGRAPYRRSYESYRKEDEELAERFFRSVGMYDKKDRSFSTLSGGEKQRVLIARSLVQGADILLLDEPTNHLDIFYQLFLIQTIKDMDKTVISVFHDLNLAASYCDHLYVLKNGKIVQQGTVKEVITKEMLRKCFSVEADIIDHNGKPYVIYKEPIKNTMTRT